MNAVGEILERAKRWLAENGGDGGMERAWDAAHSVVDPAGPDELSEAVRELVEAAESGNKDAESVVAAFRRFHPAGALGNPERQRQLIGLYLVFSADGLWDTSSGIEDQHFREAVRRLFE